MPPRPIFPPPKHFFASGLSTRRFFSTVDRFSRPRMVLETPKQKSSYGRSFTHLGTRSHPGTHTCRGTRLRIFPTRSGLARSPHANARCPLPECSQRACRDLTVHSKRSLQRLNASQLLTQHTPDGNDGAALGLILSCQPSSR